MVAERPADYEALRRHLIQTGACPGMDAESTPSAESVRLTTDDLTLVLLAAGPVCTCCATCADKASERIMLALDERGWAIVDEALIDGEAGG